MEKTEKKDESMYLEPTIIAEIRIGIIGIDVDYNHFPCHCHFGTETILYDTKWRDQKKALQKAKDFADQIIKAHNVMYALEQAGVSCCVPDYTWEIESIKAGDDIWTP